MSKLCSIIPIGNGGIAAVYLRKMFGRRIISIIDLIPCHIGKGIHLPRLAVDIIGDLVSTLVGFRFYEGAVIGILGIGLHIFFGGHGAYFTGSNGFYISFVIAAAVGIFKADSGGVFFGRLQLLFVSGIVSVGIHRIRRVFEGGDHIGRIIDGIGCLLFGVILTADEISFAVIGIGGSCLIHRQHHVIKVCGIGLIIVKHAGLDMHDLLVGIFLPWRCRHRDILPVVGVQIKRGCRPVSGPVAVPDAHIDCKIAFLFSALRYCGCFCGCSHMKCDSRLVYLYILIHIFQCIRGACDADRTACHAIAGGQIASLPLSCGIQVTVLQQIIRAYGIIFLDLQTVEPCSSVDITQSAVEGDFYCFLWSGKGHGNPAPVVVSGKSGITFKCA